MKRASGRADKVEPRMIIDSGSVTRQGCGDRICPASPPTMIEASSNQLSAFESAHASLLKKSPPMK